ncbi:hypothetical protein [Vibrio panuliri]|uniref:Uncharacterized protein n=1 Tax=Vibrio panuliri TaxID=1381081 RepID=A0ABX3FJJ1_9VIBR|nr:hypothetical protein [Vibrio panuliri]KAB1460852.1 hypothetical protein F7O85_00310 [Vibrio panuliri]OLQ91657.1 hypothetical protein BIY20_09650 [Vibrio panuliri]
MSESKEQVEIKKTQAEIRKLNSEAKRLDVQNIIEVIKTCVWALALVLALNADKVKTAFSLLGGK